MKPINLLYLQKFFVRYNEHFTSSNHFSVIMREVTLSELRDSIARLRDRVKLVCRTRGSPPPRVHWLKDGIPLHPRRGLKIQHKSIRLDTQKLYQQPTSFYDKSPVFTISRYRFVKLRRSFLKTKRNNDEISLELRFPHKNVHLFIAGYSHV
uniref:Immunoglobulin I-set domain-containing protein n=1 Tax=Vespula pensylvanica TaxID=30213 RepID=A0A834PH37_VESPE|nr:hypothetical protein H0235_001801 [Vespula pensylvanica]